MNLSIPHEAPEMSPLKLITMTVNAHIHTNLNLDVIARHTQLNDVLLGISYRDIVRGVCSKNAKPKVLAGVDYYRTDTSSGKFKNQCTFIINAGDKNVNTKVFNNGHMVNVGCKDPSHALITANVLKECFKDMEGLVIYDIPDTITNSNTKKFFKDDLRKKFGDLIQLLVCELDLDFNIEPFNSALSADDSYLIFQDELNNNSNYGSDIMYIYTIISILKSYYDESDLLEHFNDPEFQYILTMIIDYTDREAGEIACSFPSYLNNKSSIIFNPDTIQVALINKSTNCGYYINRSVLVELLTLDPGVLKCIYDKNRYPGVITVYRTSSKDVKIILFNTGKINITATRTHEQVEEAYNFISEFCSRKFNALLLRSEYRNKLKEYEDRLPTQHYVGVIGDQQYYLLKKSSITSNPRNVRFLNNRKLLNSYRESTQVPAVQCMAHYAG